MKKILVPTDFSDHAKRAFFWAAELAAKSGAMLEIMHANTAAAYAPVLPDYYSPELMEFEDYAQQAADDLRFLKKELAREEKFDRVEVETRVEEGLLHATISKLVEEDECDLVVMGTKGATGAAEFFVGSNTEKVIRMANCPVLAVPASAGEFNLQRVLLPSTLLPDQMSAFEWLAEWQKFQDFEVKILYLNNPAGLMTMDAIEEKATTFCKQTGLKNANTFAASNVLNEEMTILKFAEEMEIGLIAMATHQRRGVSHLLFGSLTEDAANHSDVPVLAIPIKK